MLMGHEHTNSARYKLSMSPQDFPEFEYHLAVESGKSPKPSLLILMRSSGEHINLEVCFTCSIIHIFL